MRAPQGRRVRERVAVNSALFGFVFSEVTGEERMGAESGSSELSCGFTRFADTLIYPPRSTASILVDVFIMLRGFGPIFYSLWFGRRGGMGGIRGSVMVLLISDRLINEPDQCLVMRQNNVE